MKVPNYKKNPNKYCNYHRDKGHNINKCYHLKKLIERMIKEAKLNQFVRDLKDRLGPKNNQEEPEAEELGRRERIRGKVKIISGGSELDRDSKAAKKKYARQVYNLYQFGQEKPHMPMTFSTEDYEDFIRPHEDPLIINPLIGQTNIWEVLVDTGSSANILFHKTYYKMNLEGEQLEQAMKYLSTPLGDNQYSLKLYVIRIESPYNAILGRPFMSTFEVVESIPHLKIKFPTEKGVGEMRGDQKTDRIIILEDLEKDQAYEKPDET
ncbi:uncharacterized protein LOC141685422 [Apium graveolens]|uniref:uncharacterized protein LOC141685422 n=1 Tax=Apium graveolens TaxID=4045 RepID=UPI003D78FDD2